MAAEVAPVIPSAARNLLFRPKREADSSAKNRPQNDGHGAKRRECGALPYVLSARGQFNPQAFPEAVDFLFGLIIHDDFVGPGARESLAGPLFGGVDAHL